MTDLTKAKQVAQRLRITTHMSDRNGFLIAANTIDALVAEVETLRDSCAAKADRIDRLGETVERLTKVDVEPSTTDSANRSADSAKPFCNNDLTPNHLCKGRWVHLPSGEQCDKCGGEQK